MRPARIAIIGGGISGLATAFQLRERAAGRSQPVDIALLEASSRPGGPIHTERREGFTIEWGPNGFLDNVAAMRRLVDRLDLASELLPAEPSAARRFLYCRGRLQPLPAGPIGFLRSPILSWRGRLRALMEPFVRVRGEGIDETVHQFACRRVGSEAAEVLVDAMVSGVFAGDPRRLSLSSAFPNVARMEAEHGSLVGAMVARGRQRRRTSRSGTDAPGSRTNRPDTRDGPRRTGRAASLGGRLTTFRPGMANLVDRLSASLGGTVRTGRVVCGLEPASAVPSGGGAAATREEPRWRLLTDAGESLDVDVVVIAVPATAAAALVGPLDPLLAGKIGGIPCAGLAVVALGFDAEEIGGQPRGFGFLAPRCAGLRTLGCLWDSSIFPGRAPVGRVLMRSMIGGARDPQAVDLDDDALVETARRDLASTMGVSAAPQMVRVVRHPVGIPQYEPGHGARLESIQERLRELPGLWVTGSSYYGISMNSCVEVAERQAEAILGSLQHLGP